GPGRWWQRRRRRRRRAEDHVDLVHLVVELIEHGLLARELVLEGRLTLGERVLLSLDLGVDGGQARGDGVLRLRDRSRGARIAVHERLQRRGHAVRGVEETG